MRMQAAKRFGGPIGDRHHGETIFAVRILILAVKEALVKIEESGMIISAPAQFWKLSVVEDGKFIQNSDLLLTCIIRSRCIVVYIK